MAICAKLGPTLMLSLICAYLFIYGLIILAIELTDLCNFITLFIILPFATYCAINYASIPQPDESLVKEVLGLPIIKSTKSDNVTESLFNESQNSSETELITIKAIAHRAAGLDAPENSISAIKLCHEKGCVAVEIDVNITKDNVLVCFHDEDLSSVCSLKEKLQDLVWDDIKDIDITARHPYHDRFAGETIALFDDVVSLCLDLDLRIIIDLKASGRKIVNPIIEVFDKNPALYKRAMLSSVFPLPVYLVRRQRPTIVCSLALNPMYFVRNLPQPLRPIAPIMDCINNWFVECIALRLLGISALLLHKDWLTIRMRDKWASRKVRLMPWPVNLPIEKLYCVKVLLLPYITDTVAYDQVANS